MNPAQNNNSQQTSNSAYSATAKFLHWSMAWLIIINYLMGLYVHNAQLFLIHEQIGLSILVLVIIRILWHWHAIPAKNPALNFKPTSLIAKSSQQLLYWIIAIPLRLNAILCSRYILLYALMLLIPVSGILTVDAKAYHPLSFWWLVTLPTTIAKQATGVTHVLVVWHIWLSHALMLIVLVHSIIALIHHYLFKDRLLSRMLP